MCDVGARLRWDNVNQTLHVKTPRVWSYVGGIIQRHKTRCHSRTKSVLFHSSVLFRTAFCDPTPTLLPLPAPPPLKISDTPLRMFTLSESEEGPINKPLHSPPSGGAGRQSYGLYKTKTPSPQKDISKYMLYSGT